MARSIFHLKLLNDDACDHGSVPDAGSKAVVHGSVVDDFPQSQLLLVIQKSGAARALTFQQSFMAKLFIVAQPLRDFRTRSIQNAGNLSAAASIVVEKDSM